MKTTSLIAREKSDYSPIPEGQHRAVLSGIASIGLQESFGSTRNQIVTRFEFPDLRVEREENGKVLSQPRAKWTFYTLSLHSKANLRQDLETLRGRGFTRQELEGFDVMSVLGYPCLVTIIHAYSGERVKDKVTSISRLYGDGEAPKAELPLIAYTNDSSNDWDLLPEWIREKIRNQIPAEIPTGRDPEPEAPDDADIPF